MGFLHCFADTVRKKPSGLHGTTDGALKLARAKSLLAAAKQVEGLEPDVQRHMAGLEYRPDTHGKLLTASVAFPKAGAHRLPFEPASRLQDSTVRTYWAIRPELRL